MPSNDPKDGLLLKGDTAAKKRTRSPIKGKTDEMSLKRFCGKVESTTRMVCDGDEDFKGMVERNFESSLNINHLLLENQWLRLENKHKAELRSMEKDTLKLVTELKTENRLLTQEISRWKKENSALRCKRDTSVGLKKGDIEQRLKKFPWLLNFARDVKTTWERKVQFEWKDLPADVAFAILKWLSDEDLFVLRGLCSQFYEAFYGQEDYVDCERCIWLAKRGRKFANLKFIRAFDDFTWKEFRVLGPCNFPKLEVLWLGNSSPRLMLPHSHLKELQFTALDYDDLQYVSDKQFPSLEVLIFNAEEDLFEEHLNRLKHLPSHKSLMHFGLGFCEPSLEEIQELTKEKFPRLKTVGITGDLRDVPEVLEYLQKQGIEFTDNIKKLSLNQPRFREKRGIGYLMTYL